LGTLSTVARPITSFAYANDSGGEHIYYCATNGRLYQKEVVTALEWRIPSMSCRGFSLVYRSSTRTLVVPVEQTGLNGVAEYVLP